MKQAKVFVHGTPAGVLRELERGKQYVFRYFDNYSGDPVSLTMPLDQREHQFDTFPPYFEGVLPEGVMLEGLLRTAKIDGDDLFTQLITVGKDLVGAVTVEEMT